MTAQKKEKKKRKPVLEAVYQERAIVLRMVRYLFPYKGLFLMAIVCMIIFGSSSGAVPFLVQKIPDKVFKEHQEGYLYLFPLVLVALAIIRGLSDFGQQYFMSKVGHLVVRDLRQGMNDHFIELGPDYFIRRSSGDLLSRVTSDVILVRSFLTDCVAAVIRDIVTVIVLLISALLLDPILTLIAFVAFPLGIYPVYRFGRKMRELSRRGQDKMGVITSLLNETIHGIKVIKIFGAEEFEKEKFSKENELLARTFIKSERIKALTGPINEVLASCAIAGVIYYGGSSVLSQTRTAGDFVGFMVAVFLLYEPFKKLSKISGTVQQGLSAAQRVFEIFDETPLINEPSAPRELPAQKYIHLKEVSFQYPSSSRQVLKNITLEIPEGKKIALVGLSGSGKSTLVDLIPRFIDPSRGEVLIGGIPVSSLSLRDLRSCIAMVSQHTFLFNDSIRRNIIYGKQEATEEEVREAARRAYALPFIEALPQGFDSLVGEGGYSLSGGERQRIAIARALLKDAPILILDEATASLDNRSEREVQSALRELESNRTTIVIAHRLSTIEDADEIIVMKEGEIVERGTHRELLEKQTEYALLASHLT